MDLPEITPMFIIVSSLASFIASMFSAMAGGGAGLILLPILLFLNIPYVNALASHKMAMGFIGIGSLIRYFKEKILDLRIVLISGIVPLPFVVLGTQFSSAIDGELMKLILGIIIVCLCAFTYFFDNKKKIGIKKEITNRDIIIMLLLLAPIAFFNGWISAGSGFFVTMVYLYVLKYNYLKSVATMLCANGIFWNMTGAIAHIYLGHVAWMLAPGLVIGAIAGSYIGSHIVVKKGNSFVKTIFLIASIVIGGLLIWSWKG